MGNDEKSSGWKWIIILILLAGAGAGGAWFFKNKGEAKPEFTVTKVGRGEVIQTVTATGTLKPVLNVEVGSQISGIIQSLYVDFNSEVKSNQVIAQLDASTYRANVSSAEGELANSQASLELAQINARRAADLFKSGLISQADHDQSVATLHQAEAQVRIRSAALERAKVDLGRCTIYAPVDGIVIDRRVDVGQTVAASMSAPVLFQIANDLTRMQINASVAEADVGSVVADQAVEFTVDAFPYRKFHGKVTQVRNSPITVQNVVTYDTIIEVNNDDLKLKPGMTANVSIVTARREAALTVPNSVLRFRPPDNAAPKGAATTAPVQVVAATERPAGERPGGGERRRGQGGERGGERGNRPRAEMRPARTLYTLAVDPAKATPADLQPQQVKLGISDGLVTEVIEGLNEGDVVVASMTTAGGSPSAAPVNNPFGGGGGFPRR
jgi:HlyD family secretion protein